MVQKVLNKIDSLLTRQRVVGYSRAMLLTFIAFLIIFSMTGHIDKRVFSQGDFMAFYTAGIIVNDFSDQGNINLYDFEMQRDIQVESGIINPDETPTVYLNPPIFAWIMLPFSKMPYVLALNVWRFVSILVALFSVILLTKQFKIDLKWWDTLTILIVSMPVFGVILSGQNTFIFIGLYAISYFFLLKNHDFTAGLFLGLGALKPQLFIFLPVVLFFQRKWSALSGFTLGFLSLMSLSALLIGPEGMIKYLNAFTTDAYLYGIQVQAHKMHSFPAFIRLILGLELNTTFLTVFAFMVLTIVIGYLSKKRNLQMETSGLLSLSILGSLIIAPHLFHYDLALLMLPFLFIYSWRRDAKQHYNILRNSRLSLLALYVILWCNFFITEIVRIQFSVILMIYLFVIIVKRQLLAEGHNQTKTSIYS